jgi:hypothetical protein
MRLSWAGVGSQWQPTAAGGAIRASVLLPDFPPWKHVTYYLSLVISSETRPWMQRPFGYDTKEGQGPLRYGIATEARHAFARRTCVRTRRAEYAGGLPSPCASGSLGKGSR